MIARHISSGSGVVGLYRYLTHDKATPDARHPATSTRVGWIDTLGSPTADPELTMRIMQGLVADADIIKARSGIGTGGRKLKTAYGHFMVGWPPGEAPPIDGQRAACRSMARALGLEDHLVILIGHTDIKQHHVHAIACKINGDTGRANNLKFSHQMLSAWALDWERSHGGIQIQTRVTRTAERAEFNAAVNDEMDEIRRTDNAGQADDQVGQPLTRRGQSRKRRKTRETAVARVRGRGDHALTPLSDKARKHGPRPDERTPEQVKEWGRLFRDPAFKAMLPAEQSIAKRTLAATQRLERAHDAQTRAAAEKHAQELAAERRARAAAERARAAAERARAAAEQRARAAAEKKAQDLAAEKEARERAAEPVPDAPAGEVLPAAAAVTPALRPTPATETVLAWQAQMALPELSRAIDADSAIPTPVPLSDRGLRVMSGQLRASADEGSKVHALSAAALDGWRQAHTHDAAERAAAYDREPPGKIAGLMSAVLAIVDDVCERWLGRSPPAPVRLRPARTSALALEAEQKRAAEEQKHGDEEPGPGGWKR